MSRGGKYNNDSALAKYAFDNYSLRPPPEDIIHNCSELTEYLEKSHSFRLLDDYIEYLNKPNRKGRVSNFSISFKTIESIISVCNMWKEFIDIKDYDKLVCGEIISMIRIHSCVISARNFEERKGITLKKQPSSTFITMVNNLGDIVVYQ